MILTAAVAAALFAGVIPYSLMGGADFGSGFYDLTAGNGIGGAQLRALIEESMGPVWEANHVWLIYVIVMWWTAFPAAFSAAMSTLFIPLSVALAGIVLRGASFAFRHFAASRVQARLFGASFAAASLITPFFLGTVAGALASGRVPAHGHGPLVESWANPTSLTGGVLAVATCVFLAGAYLTADASRAGLSQLADRMRRRTLITGILVGLIVFGGVYPILRDAPTLGRGLLGRALPLMIVAVLAGVLTLALLCRRVYRTVRISAAVAVGAAIAGWGVAQYPWISADQLTIQAAAGASTTLGALMVVVAFAAVSVLPSLAYLLWFTQKLKTPSVHRPVAASSR
jgi:cytochrome bd ubiquinol oxidase subunit II